MRILILISDHWTQLVKNKFSINHVLKIINQQRLFTKKHNTRCKGTDRWVASAASIQSASDVVDPVMKNPRPNIQLLEIWITKIIYQQRLFSNKDYLPTNTTLDAREPTDEWRAQRATHRRFPPHLVSGEYSDWAKRNWIGDAFRAPRRERANFVSPCRVRRDLEDCMVRFRCGFLHSTWIAPYCVCALNFGFIPIVQFSSNGCSKFCSNTLLAISHERHCLDFALGLLKISELSLSQ